MSIKFGIWIGKPYLGVHIFIKYDANLIQNNMRTIRQKTFITFCIVLFSFAFLQARTVKDYDVRYNQVQNNEFTLDFSVNTYSFGTIEKDGVTYSVLNFNGGVQSSKKGWAELPFLGTSVQLPNNKNISIEVLNSEYKDYTIDFPMLPSRGTIYRNQDPSTIPYEIDPASLVDAWYPVDLFSGTEPYIMRDVRGENIYVYPFQYNPVQNKLRVYTMIQLRVYENTEIAINPLLNASTKIAREMPDIYNSIFINYKQNSSKWTNEIGEYGEILVIYTSRDATVIQPWITWKKEMGYKVHELQVATGTNVKTSIQTAYTSNDGILYVLLVGDWADIKSDLGTSQSAAMDPMLGCVVGSDDYHDIIIGRFSASTTTHVTTQGSKAIAYEKTPDVSGTWYSVGLGIGSDEGSGIGDDGEIDYAHIDIIKENKLIPFTYTSATEAYGASVPVTTVSNAINSGLSVINYCGHGAHDYWVTSNYSVTNANAATNGSKLPFVFSVACVVGEFHNGTDCLAEALLRKSGGGAVATWMATLNQPWTPPMRGQDYANDILTQGYNYTSGPGNGTNTTYGKTTFGSITFNAASLMIAESAATDDWDTYKTWTIFGDPSLQVRTETPKAITLSNYNVPTGTYTTNVSVSGSPFQNALVSLYKSGDPQPYSGLTDASGNVTITHSLTGTVKLTVTGFNLATINQDVTIASPNPPVCDFSASQTTVTAGSTVNFTDLSTNFPTSWSWTFSGGTPTSSTVQNPSVVYNTAGVYTVSLTVVNGAGNDTETKTNYITVTAVTTPPVANFTANATSISAGGSVNFTDLSTNLPTSWSWTFAGGNPSTSTSQNPSNIIYAAQGIYDVSLTVTNAYGNDTETKTGYIVVGPDPAFSLDFEACLDYSADFSPWSVYDGDGITTYSSSDCDFPGEAGAMSFMAFNPSDAGFTLASPHGGVRCGMSICPSDGSESDDWMISPQLTLGDNSSISLWALSPKPGSWGNDAYKVLVSTTNNQPTSFTSVSGATAIIAPSTWTQHTYDLSAYDNQQIYLAIQHISTDKFILWVDDIVISTTLNSPVYPVAGFTTNATTVCAGSTVTFTNTSTDATSYQWTFPGGTPSSSTATSPTITFNTAGAYTVTLQATNAEGTDTETTTINVTANVTPSVSISASDNSICAGETVTFTPTPSNGGTTPTYNWLVNSVSVGSGASYSSSSLTDNAVVTCTMTSSLTCVTSSTAISNSININVDPVVNPTISISASATTICVGQNVTFTPTATNQGTSPVYNWMINGVNAGTGSTFSSSTLSDSDVVTCQLTSSLPCNTGPVVSNSITFTVNNPSPVSVSVSSNLGTVICMGETVIFTANPVNGGTPSYQWYLNGSLTGSNSPTYTNSSVNNGDQIYCVINSSLSCVTGNPANSNTISMTVSSSIVPTISISTGNTSVCSGQSVTFISTVTGEGASPTYNWQVNGVSVGSGSTYTSNSLNNGDVVSCILTSSSSCASVPQVGSNNIPITVNQTVNVSVSISSSAGNSICQGDPVTLTATPVNPGTTPIYQWYVNGVPAGSNSPTYTTSSLLSGDVVFCQLTSSEPCAAPSTTSSLSITFTVVSEPVANYYFTTNDLTVSLTNSSLNATSYMWYFGDGNSTNMPNPVHTYNQDGLYDVMLIASNSCGSDTLIYSINVFYVGSNNNQDITEIKVFPNPTSGMLNILSNTEISVVTVYNLIGKKIIQTRPAEKATSVDLSVYGKGLYIIEIATDKEIIKKQVILD